MNRKLQLKQSGGITLVSLVVTVIVLAILASITIASVFGDNGLLNQSKDVKDKAEEKVDKSETSLNKLLEEYESAISGSGGNNDNTNTTEPDVPDIPEPSKGPTTVEDAIKDGNYFEDTTTITDSKGNEVVIPGDFKVSDESTTVQQGIVIEDKEGNQFVWVPLGVVRKDDGTETEPIELGRYKFDTTNGTPTLQQSADNYTQTVTILLYYKELSTFRESNYSSGTDALNATAKNLEQFITKSKANGGYYIARFEASYGSGSSVTDYKPLSQKSKTNSIGSMSYTKGRLWNFIKQGDASKVSRNMYAGNLFVESDLINSYAWDTAIVYIQKCSNNSNYANANRDTVSQTALKNTGETGDEVCHINDMATNLREWTTEYSDSANAYPCVVRGGFYDNSTHFMSVRLFDYTTNSRSSLGFRSLLYVK